jgi:hypothetical protein
MKIRKFLGFIALAVLVVLPIKANAETWGLSYPYETDSEGYTVVTVKGTQTDHTSTSYSVSMTLTNMELVSAEGVGTWIVNQSGTELTFTSTTPVTDSEFTIATLKFKKIDSSQECNVVFKCDTQTKTVTPSKTTTNPTTGNILPYAVIMAGIVIAGTVYYVTRKNTKLYKI